MAETSPSLLLDGATRPADGVTTAKAIYWPGGELFVTYQGTFDGASIGLVCTMNMPPKGKIPAAPTDWMADADWVPLGDAVSGQASKAGYRIGYGHVNPCMLAMRVAGSTANTRVKALVS